MAYELLANYGANTRCSGAYTSGSGVLNVDSTAAPFPQTGNFRVVITDKDDGSPKVILKVTAVNSGTQWNVTAEGTDASADDDDYVYAVLTDNAIRSILIDYNLYGAQASLPAAADILQGQKYQSSNGPYSHLKDASAIQYLYGPRRVAKVPVVADWTKQGTGTITDATGGGINFLGAASSWTALYKAVPGGGTYTFTLGMYFLLSGGSGGNESAIAAATTDGTKFKYTLLSSGNAVRVQYNTALNTFSANKVTQSNVTFVSHPVFFKIVTTSGISRTYHIGDGDEFVQVWTEGDTQDFTPTHIGFALFGGSGTVVASARVIHWETS